MKTKTDTTTSTSPVQTPKRSVKKAVFIGLGLAVTAVGGFLGWNWWNSKKQNSTSDFETQDLPITEEPKTSSSSSTKPATRRDEFPLKKGSRGERVKAVQEKLISKYGKDVLPKFGADGDFGSEMVAALEKKGFPAEINESTYNLLVKGSAPDYSSLAKRLYEASENKNYSAAIDALKQIRNTSDYSQVSEKFKNYRVDGGVRKTLVTGMLDTFKTSAQQDAIRMQFLRMGLKYDGSKWSLSGLGNVNEKLLITNQPTELIDFKHKVKVKVPKDMVIGNFIQTKNGYTLFKTLEKNKKLIVKSTTVNYYENN